MQNILDTIAARKREEVAEKKTLYPVKLLEKSIYFPTQPVSLKKYLLDKNLSGIIAEFKRKSPSKGDINPFAEIGPTTLGYMQAGASALSILTDKEFFGGSDADLTTARQYNYCPILRKEFILDEYQVIEAKSIGADAILLIASLLSAEEIKQLSELANSLQMEVLLEIHDEAELDKIVGNIQHIGINNRNLKNFEVDIENSLRLVEKLPADLVKIAESGIHGVKTLIALKEGGFQGFLIGEHFMKERRPEEACRAFIQLLRQNSSTPEPVLNN